MTGTSNDQDEKAVFHAANSLKDAAQREVYLEAVCGGDQELRLRLDSLLAAADQAGAFLESPAACPQATIAQPDVALTTGKMVGPYKLLEQIGEGGFGVVYMADQLKPIQRRVALKIIKPGMDTRQVIARFEAERQALALMDHPNIAKVLDAGETETGRPYFVMELVRGIPVTEYCDDRNLTTTERLLIFKEICSAVQHAHQKGIIHRDIKPSNILVSTNGDRPVPKVIDFGIAKATQGRLTERTLFTQFRQFIGTPAYMSPEQAQMSAVDVDTRSDIYSLGVLLYELLTGKTPLDSKELCSAGYDEICRRIREEDAIAPSKRISSLERDELKTLARNRKLEPSQFPSEVRGDLDWIVMKAVEKDRVRRYATAEALAEDIERHMSKEPVSAAPPSVIYRLRRMARRNRALLLTAGGIAAALVVGTTVATWQAVRATHANVLARAETERVRKAQAAALTSTALAESEEARARRIAYASDVNGAYQALRLNNLGLARRFLDRNRNFPAGRDLRHWAWRALWAECQSDAEATFGDGRHITSLSASRDGNWLAVGGMDGGIRIWNLKTLKPSKMLVSTAADQHGFVAFAPSGNLLYATAESGVIHCWSVPAFSRVDVELVHGSQIREIDISADGSLLAVFGFDKAVTIWDLQSHDMLISMHGNWGGGSQEGAVAISPDNRRLIVGAQPVSPILDIVSGNELFVIDQSCKYGLEVSPDGVVVASGSSITKSSVNLHSAKDGELIDRLDGHTLYVQDVEMSPDGRLLASVSADQTVRLWDIESRTQQVVLRGHTNEVWAAAFTAGGERLISGAKNGEICIWNPDREVGSGWPIRLLSTVPGYGMHYGRASFSFDGKYLATRNRDGSVSLRSAKTLEAIKQLLEPDAECRGVCFSPTALLLAVGNSNGHLILLDPDKPGNEQRTELAEGEISPIRFSEDGERLLVIARGKAGSRCIIYSIPTGGQLQSWEIGSDDTSASLSPNGRFVATGHADGTVRLWNVSDPQSPKTVLYTPQIDGVTFSPDGTVLLIGDHYSDAVLLDVPSMNPVDRLRGHMMAVHSVGFSRDGRRVVTGGGPGEVVKIWDMATRQELMTLSVGGYYFQHVEFSPDGNAVLAISGAGDLNLWRVPTFEEIVDAETTHGPFASAMRKYEW